MLRTSFELLPFPLPLFSHIVPPINHLTYCLQTHLRAASVSLIVLAILTCYCLRPKALCTVSTVFTAFRSSSTFRPRFMHILRPAAQICPICSLEIECSQALRLSQRIVFGHNLWQAGIVAPLIQISVIMPYWGRRGSFLLA